MAAQAPPLAAARATRPGRWLRRVLRLPVLLYRWKLGWLLGHRFLLLTHCGRRTGLARQTVLEVLRFDPDSSTAVVMVGWRYDGSDAARQRAVPLDDRASPSPIHPQASRSKRP